MTLRQFFMILHGRLGIMALVFLATVAAVAVLSFALPKRYTATAAVVVDMKSPDPISGAMLDGLVMPGYLATQRDIIASERVARRALQLLKLDQGTAAAQSERAAALAKKLDVKPSRNSNVIDISFSAPNPAFAAAAANAFAQAYMDASIELRVDPARQSASWFGEQDRTLRENLERAQARLSQHQQKYGLGVSEERLDSEVTRLNDLATQLAQAQGQAAEANSRQRAAGPAEMRPEVVQNPLIVSLKTEIARQDAKLKELAGHLGPNHPDYRRMAAEIESLRGRLKAETAVIVGSLRTSGSVNKDKEAQLAKAVSAQKKQVLAMRQAREELAALQRDRDIAQKAYETVTQRLSQARLESRLRQTNASLLSAASEPLDPAFPNLLLNCVAAIFLGTFLALGVALVLELINRRVHSADDLVELLQLPVLAVVPGRRLAPPVARLPRRL
jgi:chain length determinant protein EpsF